MQAQAMQRINAIKRRVNFAESSCGSNKEFANSILRKENIEVKITLSNKSVNHLTGDFDHALFLVICNPARFRTSSNFIIKMPDHRKANAAGRECYLP